MTPTTPRALARVAPQPPLGAEQFLERYRDEVIDRLGVHYASDDMSMRELERRLTLAVQARTPDALDHLVADLPPAPLRELDVADLLAPDPAPERAVLAAIMGGTVRKGPWIVPRHVKVMAIMGGVEIDLRQARFAPGVTELEILAIMGGVDIFVPPGIRVEAVGVAAMGGFEVNVGEVAAPDPDAPVLRISGLAIMGGVDAKARRPGAKALQRFGKVLARLRKRAERERR